MKCILLEFFLGINEVVFSLGVHTPPTNSVGNIWGVAWRASVKYMYQLYTEWVNKMVWWNILSRELLENC